MSFEQADASVPRRQEVAEGVFAYLQPPGGWCLNNAGIIVDADEAVLVDTAATHSRARALRDAAAEVAKSAPRMVVNTHFHGDHTFGNFMFPEAVIVGHERTREAMAEAGMHLTTLWPDVEWGELSLTLPTLTYRDRLTLYLGSVRMELIQLGPAHSTDDTVVWLPEQSVLFTGDLAMSGVTPFVPMGSVSGSLDALAQLRALNAKTLVPGHGPVSGPELLDETERYLRWLRETAKRGIAAGLTPLETAAETDLGEFGMLLDSERIVPNLHRAYAEEQGVLPGAPLDIGAVFGEMIQHHGGLPVCHA